LYAFQACFKPEYGLTPDPANICGVLSLIVWSLIIVVSVKYIVFIMRADNEGEGGILALLALIRQQHRRGGDVRRKQIITWLGLIGAALLYGDGMITPAISVLGATEGLDIVTPEFKHLVVPLTIGILAGLFFVQRRGTDKVGKIFGPVMIVWFAVIAFLGLREVLIAPEILKAINPVYGVTFFIRHGFHAFVLLGAVVLVVTGAEALYADMGHFGKRPIRLAWFALVLPALLLNYFGQGALLLREPSSALNPFYLLAPRLMLYPLIALATMAAIIASQALISGAFSLSQQSVQLGFSPRVNIIHTSAREAGQIYVPEVNRALAVGTILVVLYFQSVSALGAAYGIAVTGTMAITTILFYILTRSRWNWSLLSAGVLCLVFLAIDVAFFGANALKIMQGGWVPLAVAAGRIGSGSSRDEEPHLARPPHHRLPDEAVHEFPSNRAASHRRGEGRFQHRHRLSHRARPPASIAQESAARAAAARSACRCLGQRGGAAAEEHSRLAADRHFRRGPTASSRDRRRHPAHPGAAKPLRGCQLHCTVAGSRFCFSASSVIRGDYRRRAV